MQRMCVGWFRLQYPAVGKLLFAVPNGGARSRTEAAIMKAEGVTAGVTDLILLLGREGFNALCIEMKTTDRRGAVRYENKLCGFDFIDKEGMITIISSYEARTYCIIGNIHDNPELLKGGGQ